MFSIKYLLPKSIRFNHLSMHSPDKLYVAAQDYADHWESQSSLDAFHYKSPKSKPSISSGQMQQCLNHLSMPSPAK